MKKAVSAVMLALLILSALTLSFKIVRAPYAGAWRTQTVDSGGVGWCTSIALDSDDRPCMSYFDATHGALKYAKWTGSSWSVETVDSSGGTCTSIALDSGGNPHISYHAWDATKEYLKYAKWTGLAWSIETVGPTGVGPIYTSIALDDENHPHISYYNVTDGDLNYAKWTGSEWAIETVDSAGNVGTSTSIALDSADNPHISYYDATNGYLKYASWTGSAWSIETVDSIGNYVYLGQAWTSIALDSEEKPHISYENVTDGALKYASWTGSAWSIETVDTNLDSATPRNGIFTSIALDSADRPHISYFDSSNGALKYAWWKGSAWSIQTADSGGVGVFTDVALDSAGKPHISYFDGAHGALKYAALVSTSLVVRGLDDRIYYRVWNETDWEDWMVLPTGSTIDGPATAVLGDALHIVVRGSDGDTLWHRYVNLTDNTFSDWTLLSGATPSTPTLTSNGTVLCLVVRGLDDRVYYRCYIEDSWGPWYAVPTGATCDGPAAAMLGDYLHVVVRGMDEISLWHVIVGCDGSVVEDWMWISGATSSRPALASLQGEDKLYLVVRGLDDAIYYRDYCGICDSWGDWNSLPTGTTPDGPAAVLVGNDLHVVVRGMDGYTLWHGCVNLTDDSFADWTLLSGSTLSPPTLTR